MIKEMVEKTPNVNVSFTFQQASEEHQQGNGRKTSMPAISLQSSQVLQTLSFVSPSLIWTFTFVKRPRAKRIFKSCTFGRPQTQRYADTSLVWAATQKPPPLLIPMCPRVIPLLFFGEQPC